MFIAQYSVCLYIHNRNKQRQIRQMRQPRQIITTSRCYEVGTRILIPCRYNGRQQEYEAVVIAAGQRKGAWLHDVQFIVDYPEGGTGYMQLNGYAVRRCAELLRRRGVSVTGR